MSTPFIDTNVFVRYLTGDDPVKQLESDALIEQVRSGALRVAILESVIAEAAYVLTSRVTYGYSRSVVAEMLIPLLKLPGFQIDNRDVIVRALEIFGVVNVDFVDALSVASMEAAGSTELYSYDTDFNRFPDIVRNPDLLS